MILSPLSRQCVKSALKSTFMGEIRKTYDIEFKRKAVAMFLEEGPTEEELIMAIEQYIYFYNHERFQQKLNNLSPIEFRTKVA
ncbi:hypothetical protein PAEVO_16310 [Paenibacillus sp. GM2FR]|nr:hypothetical protein PAEVO_16310 [Paenibacillus sp. GM2FR]